MGRILVASAAVALALFFRHTAQNYPSAAARLPNLLGLIIILLGTAVIVAQALEWRRQSADGQLQLVPPIDKTAFGIGVLFAALCVAYAASIHVLGYLIATPVFLLVALGALRPISWPNILLTVIAVTGVIWAVFINFLGLPMPLFPGA